eukprot:jgi/Astpho2/1321/e_gw1.00024.62.1_t
MLQGVLQQLGEANVAKRKELDWQAQNQALNDLRRLVRHHSQVLLPAMHAMVIAALPAIDALRSITAKFAMALFQELFQTLGRASESELEHIVPMLAKKAGEVSNAGRDTFLAADADRTLAVLVECCSEGRVAAALLGCVAHKSPQTRAKVAAHLDSACYQPSNVTACASAACPGLLEKVFKAATSFLEEGSLDTRTYGKRLIWAVRGLVSGEELKRLAARAGPDRKQRKVWEVLDSAGPPPPPLKAASSARQQGSSAAAAGPTSGAAVARSPGGWLGVRRPARVPRGSTSSDGGSGNLAPRIAVGGRLSSGGASEADAEVRDALGRALTRTGGRDWRDRSDALRSVAAQAGRLGDLPEAQLVAVLDFLGQHLSDGNLKVQMQDLEVLMQVLPALGNATAAGLHTLVPALVANLGSSNGKIAARAGDVLDQLMLSVNPTLLIQHFAHCMSHAQQRSKTAVIDRLGVLVDACYGAKPVLIVKHVLPAAFTLLGERRSDVRASTLGLLAICARHMGNELAVHASSLPQVQQDRIAEIISQYA